MPEKKKKQTSNDKYLTSLLKLSRDDGTLYY